MCVNNVKVAYGVNVMFICPGCNISMKRTVNFENKIIDLKRRNSCLICKPLQVNKALAVKCIQCSNIFKSNKRRNREGKVRQEKFCSKKCLLAFNEENRLKTSCSYCGAYLSINFKYIHRNKNNRYFCNKSCAAIYNNEHKNLCGVSLMEKFIQEKLQTLYPDIEFLFNNRYIIRGELDIYLPEYKLAFELNGIVHYEPIYGMNKLEEIQNRDKRKFQQCLEQNIELAVIDTNHPGSFKEKYGIKYLNIIKLIIDNRVKMGKIQIGPVA